ncbi:MAG: hypothetical protein J5785_01945 [Spirochaetales bacterium]|nr:hypothetical protein [Spirochaetales bacterium]
MEEVTGKQRLERLYERLKKNYPNEDIRFEDETLIIGKYKLVKFKVAYYINGRQMCDAVWGDGSYGFKENLLEFYNWDEPIGNITEHKAYKFFEACIETERRVEANK